MRFFYSLFFICSLLRAPTFAQPAESAVILGGGIGALTSALYLSRLGIEPIVLEGGNPGGLITQSFAVENWPGELEISGSDLVEKIRKQAVANGVKFYAEEVVAVDFSKRPFIVTTRSLSEPNKVRQIRADSCIIAMGTRSNYLGVPGETGPDGYWGRGVTNCAVCDGAFYRDRVVGIVGGGDAAVLEGLYLSQIAKEVYFFVRKSTFKAGEIKRLEALLESPNVHVLYDTEVVQIQGDGEHLTHVTLQSQDREVPYDLPLDGLFLAIGSQPNTEMFQEVLQLDQAGYIQLIKDQATSIAGVFAIGDIVDPVYKQAISAAGDGARAAIQVQKYLFDRTDQLAARKAGKKTKGTVAKTTLQNPSAAPPAASLVASSAPISGGVIEIRTKEQFDRELKKNQIPVAIDFYANWCGPCKTVAPQFEAAAAKYSGKIKFFKVNVDQFYGLAQSYGVSAMPTVVVLDETGAVVEKRVGPEAILNFLKNLDTQ